MVTKLIRPSINLGFARSAGESANPGLWNGLKGAWCPSLGVQGNQLIDQSSYKINGSFVNSPTWGSGELGTHLSFARASSQYVNLGTNSNFDFDTYDKGLTILGWVKPDTPGGSGNEQTLASRLASSPTTDRPFELQIGTDNKWHMAINSYADNVKPPTTATGLVWTQVAGVWKPSDYTKIYINGVEEGTKATAESVLDPCSVNFVIGANTGGATHFFNGQIAIVLLYNRPLNPNEIMQLYIDPYALFRLRDQVYKAPAAPAGGVKVGSLVNGGLVNRGLIGGRLAI